MSTHKEPVIMESDWKKSLLASSTLKYPTVFTAEQREAIASRRKLGVTVSDFLKWFEQRYNIKLSLEALRQRERMIAEGII